MAKNPKITKKQIKRKMTAREAAKNLEAFGYTGGPQWASIDNFIKANPRARAAVTANKGLMVRGFSPGGATGIRDDFDPFASVGSVKGVGPGSLQFLGEEDKYEDYDIFLSDTQLGKLNVSEDGTYTNKSDATMNSSIGDTVIVNGQEFVKTASAQDGFASGFTSYLRPVSEDAQETYTNKFGETFNITTVGKGAGVRINTDTGRILSEDDYGAEFIVDGKMQRAGEILSDNEDIVGAWRNETGVGDGATPALAIAYYNQTGKIMGEEGSFTNNLYKGLIEAYAEKNPFKEEEEGGEEVIPIEDDDLSVVKGCTNPEAENYDPLATEDDGSCILPQVVVKGCTNPEAENYNPLATEDDGSCILPEEDTGDDTGGDTGGDTVVDTGGDTSGDTGGTDTSLVDGTTEVDISTGSTAVEDQISNFVNRAEEAAQNIDPQTYAEMKASGLINTTRVNRLFRNNFGMTTYVRGDVDADGNFKPLDNIPQGFYEATEENIGDAPSRVQQAIESRRSSSTDDATKAYAFLIAEKRVAGLFGGDTDYLYENYFNSLYDINNDGKISEEDVYYIQMFGVEGAKARFADGRIEYTGSLTTQQKKVIDDLFTSVPDLDVISGEDGSGSSFLNMFKRIAEAAANYDPNQNVSEPTLEDQLRQDAINSNKATSQSTLPLEISLEPSEGQLAKARETFQQQQGGGYRVNLPTGFDGTSFDKRNNNVRLLDDDEEGTSEIAIARGGYIPGLFTGGMVQGYQGGGATYTVAGKQLTEEQLAQGQADLSASAMLDPAGTVAAAPFANIDPDTEGAVLSATTGQALGVAPVVTDPAKVTSVTTADPVTKVQAKDSEGKPLVDADGKPIMVDMQGFKVGTTKAEDKIKTALEGGLNPQAMLEKATEGRIFIGGEGPSWNAEKGKFVQGGVETAYREYTPEEFAKAYGVNLADFTSGGVQAAKSTGPTKTIEGQKRERQKVDPETGKPMFDADGKPIMETFTDVSGVEAAQETATKVEGAPTRTEQKGEMLEGATVDQTKVAEAFGTGEVKAASVKDELTTLMNEFEGDDYPPWAAGAMRKANQELARRGLSASTMAGQAIVQAMMESALPIAQIDAGNKQQVAMFKAEQRAKFMQMEFDQDFQARVTNAARVSEIANMNFSADQQIALENAKMAQTINLANLTNRQATIMAEAAQLSQLELANLSNEQQAQVQNAQNFLQMDMANLNNKQQTEIFKAQANVNAILSDTAATNAAAQFNASSENQTQQFVAQMKNQVNQFNSAQINAMKQYNAGEENAVLKFNSQLQNQREVFNAQMYAQIAQANAKWRQDTTTINTAAANESNFEYAKNVNGLTSKAIDQIWQKERDIMSFAMSASENALDRALQIALGNQTLKGIREKLDYQEEKDSGAFWTRFLWGSSISDWKGLFNIK